MNKQLLQKAIEEKKVSVQKHPTEELYIYNYTPSVQYEKLWDEITLNTRGLIMDSEMNIIAKPFGKFFNLEEVAPDQMPNLPFDVFEKMDGSLGILYWVNDTPFIATRGSFDSEQAKAANKMLNSTYSYVIPKLEKGKTYLFEIIYPQNRIVVNYGTMEALVLLTCIDNKTGIETLPEIGFPTVIQYSGVNDFTKLRDIEKDNSEGFVIRFSNGFRVKMKYAEYVRLHRIITGVSNVVIWEYLSQNKSLKELLEKVPDEFYDYVKNTSNELLSSFANVLDECERVYKEFPTRKESALYFTEQKYPSILFMMLDKKSLAPAIWKIVRPKYCKPFKTEI